MDRNTRRVVAAAFVVAASCNVYDPSLLVGGGGSSSGAKGGTGNGGSSGKGGSSTGGSGGSSGSTVAGSSGTGGNAGKASGGSAGASSGRGGTSGGSGGAGATAGTGGTDPIAGAGGEGGEAGMGPSMGGTGGQGGTGGAGAGGKGGTAGTGGSGGAGTGGTGGAGTGGTGGAGAGAGGTGGAVTATGCAKLTVPLNEATDQARFAISYSTSSPINVSSGTTVTTLLYVAAGNAGAFAPYVQDSSYNILRSATTTTLSGTGTWRTVTWNVSAEPVGTTGIVLTSIIRLGIQIWANGATTGLVDPSVVYIDSITVSTPSASYPFTTSATVDTTPTSNHENSPGIMWLNNYNADTLPETLTGTSLAWVATCP